ncbi:MAG: polymerase-associated protein RapA [Pseudomonadota bacterium]
MSPGLPLLDEPATAIVRVDAVALLKQVLRGERVPVTLAETRVALTELGRRRSGLMPAALLVDQVLKVTDGTDWPCRRAALDALLRRLGFAQRDELTISALPASGSVFGRYELSSHADAGDKSTRSRSKVRRPYRTEIYALDPLHVSCDCADFRRSSLGLCKHLLVVLEELARAPRKWSAGLAEQASTQHSLPALRWDPVRSWSGAGDRLTGLRWHRSSPPLPISSKQRPAKERALAEALERSFQGEALALSELANAEQRLAVLESLDAALATGVLAAEPAAAAVIQVELAHERRRGSGRAGAKAALSHLKTLSRKLYPYQLEGVRRLLQEQRLLLADDMGLGKTTQAIAACHALFESGRVSRGLLIVPAPLKTQWLREWQATSQVPIELVEGTPQERRKQLRPQHRGFLVMNYEQLLRDLEAVHRFDPEVVVLDEAQRIKNWATKTNAHVMSLQPEWRLVLTGTPLENRLEELATLLDWIDEAALSPKWRLEPWHTTWGSEGGAERVGARHLDTLRQRMSHCVLRRIRRDVLAQLPPRTDVRVPVEMTEPQREEHDARILPIAQLTQAAQRRPLRQAEFLKLMQLLAQQRIISNGMAQFRFDEVWPVYSRARPDDALLSASASPKLAEFRRLILDLALTQERKVVVFSQWRKMLRLAHWAVHDLLEDAGLRAVFFTGEESQRARTQNVVEFHEDASVRVMFLSDAGAVGLNLQHAASACINLELPWNPAVLEQRVGRIYRLGQTQPIDVCNLVTEYGIESRIAGLIGSKEALFNGLFDGTTDSVRFDAPSGFLKNIERLVENVQVPLPASDTEGSAEDAGGESATSAVALQQRESDLAPAATHDAPAPAASELHSVATTSGVHRLFQQISVTRTETGALRLEAPPEVAEELAQLLQGFASLLGAAPFKGST